MNTRSHSFESMNNLDFDLVDEQLVKAKAMVKLILAIPDLNAFHKSTLFDSVWALDEHVGIALEAFHGALVRFDRYATHSIDSLKSRGHLGQNLYKAQQFLAELLTSNDPEQLNHATLQGYLFGVEKHVAIALEHTACALMTEDTEEVPLNKALYTPSTLDVPKKHQQGSAGSKQAF